MRKMKDSGIEWVGQIPEDWIPVNPKSLFGLRTQRVCKGDEQLTASQKYGIISQRKFMELENQNVVTVDKDFGILKHVEPNDFVISMRSFQGGLEYSSIRGCISSAYVMLIPDLSKVYPPCYKWLFKSSGYISALQSTSNLVRDGQAMRYSNFVKVRLFKVPIEEQKKIADFLDKKCSDIDLLVADIEKQIATLDEYKKSVITEAVTKGLNPDVEMKDSGVEWCPQIPVHWNRVNPKSLFRLRTQKMLAGDEQLTASQSHGIVFQKKFMELENQKVVTVEKDFSILKHVEPGDFVISMRSFQGGLEYSKVKGCISSAYVMLIPNTDMVYPPFYKWFFKSFKYINALQSTSNLIRDGQAMRYSNFVQVKLFDIPLGEQREIADYLDNKCANIDSIIADKKKQLEILKEYKKSLIYECVTGKIDCREM